MSRSSASNFALLGASDSHAEARAAARRKVFLPAELILDGMVSRVHLLNLSCIGALLHAGDPPQTGALVTIRRAEVCWSARVVWRSGTRFGVAHAQAFSQDAVEALIGGLD